MTVTGMYAVLRTLLPGPELYLTQQTVLRLAGYGGGDWPPLYEKIAKDLVIHENYSEVAKVAELVASYDNGSRAPVWLQILGQVLKKDPVPGAKPQGVQGIVLALPKIALWVDRNLGFAVEEFNNEFISVMAEVITSQSILVQSVGSNSLPDLYRTELSNLIKEWVRGRSSYQDHRFAVALKLIRKVTESQNPSSLLGEEVLDGLTFGLFTPLTPSERAKLFSVVYD